MSNLDASPFHDVLPVAQHRRAMSKVTLSLIAGVVLVMGVLIGIQAQKAFGSPAVPAAGGQRLQGGQPTTPATGQRRQGGFGGGTIGTVEKISGNQVYLKAMDGSTVKVTTTDSTTIEIAKPGKLSDLAAGSSVAVRGEKAADGSVAAVSISQGGGR